MSSQAGLFGAPAASCCLGPSIKDEGIQIKPETFDKKLGLAKIRTGHMGGPDFVPEAGQRDTRHHSH